MAAGYLQLLDWRLRDQEIRSVTPINTPIVVTTES